MRYDDPRLVDLLAREYVLGTLGRSARSRFARVLGSSLVARRAVQRWDRHFAPLAAGVAPVAPPAEVWTRIETELGFRARVRGAGTGLWAALAAALAVVAVALGTLYVTQPPEQARYVSVIADPATGPLWLFQVFADAGELRVTTVMERPIPITNSYELWMVPTNGAAPVSLGLIPSAGNAALALAAQQLAVLDQSSALAVSLEPAGGSPTGAPTTVLFAAPLIRA
jgi:anti-sigma-K factor RskA